MHSLSLCNLLTIIDGLWSEDQKFRFLIIGIWNTIFGYLVFCSFFIFFENNFFFTFPHIIALMLSQSISLFHNFYTHKNLTFRHVSHPGHIYKDFFRFSSVYVLLYIASLIFIYIFVDILNLNTFLSAILVILIVYLFGGFFGHKNYSFGKD